MSEVTNEGAGQSNPATPHPATPSSATPDEAAQAATSEPTKPGRLRVRKAIRMVKRHPIGAVAVVGAAAALFEVELAVGILTGIGATALLAKKTGPEARREVMTKGRWAMDRAKVAWARRGKSAPTNPAASAPPQSAPQAPASP